MHELPVRPRGDDLRGARAESLGCDSSSVPTAGGGLAGRQMVRGARLLWALGQRDDGIGDVVGRDYARGRRSSVWTAVADCVLWVATCCCSSALQRS